jgi:hypothetical protein
MQKGRWKKENKSGEQRAKSKSIIQKAVSGKNKSQSNKKKKVSTGYWLLVTDTEDR